MFVFGHILLLYTCRKITNGIGLRRDVIARLGGTEIPSSKAPFHHGRS